MTSIPGCALAAAFSVIANSHADRWLGRLTCGLGIAFTLHRVRPGRPDGFQPNRSWEISPSFLSTLIVETRKAGFDFVTIDDAIERLHSAQHARRPFAVLTFDDGYRDNVEFAAPILTKEGVPWTVFAVPDFLDGTGRLWWIEIEEIVARLHEFRVEDETVVCRTAFAKQRAFERLRRLCQGLGEQERKALCDRLAREAGIETRHIVSDHCLSWDEIARACRANDLTVGSHTESHAILRKCSSAASQRQINSSKSRLEKRLHRRIEHLAYPHGAIESDVPREESYALDAGYVAAWTTRPAHLTLRSYRRSPYALPRVTVNGRYANHAMIRSVLSGIPFLCIR